MRGQVKVYQKKIIAKRRRKIFLVTLYAFCSIVLLVSGLSFISQLNSLSIQRIVIEGNIRASNAQIERGVTESVAGNYGFLFSKQNIFLYPKDEIKEKLFSLLPPIKRLDISRRGLAALVVSVVEREAKSKWCSDEIESKCYFLDETGFVFAPEDSQVSPPSLFIYRGLIQEEPIGRNFLSEVEFKKVDFFIKQTENLGIEPVEAFIADTGYITITLSSGGKVYVNEIGNFTKVLENLASLITDKTVVPNMAQFLQNLDYIKIDAGNKMVYKMKI